MNSRTRREMLVGAAILSAMSAGCQLFDGGDPDDPDASTVESDDPSQLAPIEGLFVERTLDALPSNPDQASFGLTTQGLFQYDPSAGDWTSIQYGTDQVPADSLNARAATIGAEPSGRPLISNSDRTMYIDPNGGDDAGAGTRDDPLGTIQEAVQRVPIYLRDQYVIDLSTVPDTPVRYDEDVFVPTIIGTGQATREDDATEAGPFANLVIRGEQNEPESVELGSVMFANVIGTAAGNLFFVTITRDTPYDTEGFALTAYGSGEAHLYDIRFTDGASNGVLSYGSKMKASLVDVGDENVQIGIRGKRHASIIADRATGQTTGSAYFAVSNSQIGIKEGETLSGNPTYETNVGGLIHDYNTDTWHGIDASQSTEPSVVGDANGSQSTQQQTGSPTDVNRGEIWYEDGDGDNREGFYGQTRDGPVRLG